MIRRIEQSVETIPEGHPYLTGKLLAVCLREVERFAEGGDKLFSRQDQITSFQNCLTIINVAR
jgi:hypothetical protein